MNLTLEELNELLLQCGCCPMPRCCPPLVERRFRICDANACGYAQMDEREQPPGEELTIYLKLRTSDITTWAGSASHSYVNPSGDTFFNYSGTSGYNYQRTSIKDEIQLSPELRSVRLFCAGEIVTECVGKYLFTKHDWGASTGWLARTFDYAETNDTVEVTTEYSEESLSDWVHCEDRHTITSNTETGSPTGNIPTAPSYTTGIGFEDDGHTGDCVSTGTRRTYTLDSFRIHTTDTDSSDGSGGTVDDGYEYTGDATYEFKRIWDLSMQFTKADFIAWVRGKMTDGSVDWSGYFDNTPSDFIFGDSAEVAAFAVIQWPVAPAHVESSDSTSDDPPCESPSNSAGIIIARSMQYRLKLDKCCRYTPIRSEWAEVFFPLYYLNWLRECQALRDASESDDNADIIYPPCPFGVVVTPRVWVYSGMPPGCDDSDSSATESELDPYGDETMWSPWSATVMVPEGQEGIVVLMNYQQLCYGAIPDLMPGVFHPLDQSDSIADEP